MLVHVHSRVRVLVPCFVIDLVAKSRSVNDSERDAGAFFIKFEF